MPNIRRRRCVEPKALAVTAAPALPDLNDASTRSAARVAAVAGFILFQALLLKFSMHPRTPEYSGRYIILGELLMPATYFLLAFGLLVSSHFPAFIKGLLAHQPAHSWRSFMVPQMLFYGMTMLAATRLMPNEFTTFLETDESSQAVPVFLLAIGISGTLVCSFLALAPASYWRYFAATERVPLILAASFSVLAYIVGIVAQHSWDFLGGPTMALSHWLLDLFFTDVIADASTAQLGTSRFSVTIAYQCSGYEGLGMMLVFLTWYLYAFKAELRFPNAFLMIPFGLLIIWLSNAVRIAMLIGIGTLVSPDVALQGFHSNAGWICFTGIALGFACLASSSRFFIRQPKERRRYIDADTACVLPMLVLLATTLLSGALSTADFTWLYPLRPIAGGIAIALLWKYFRFPVMKVQAFPVVAGIIVFVLWIGLGESSPEKNERFASTLFGLPATLSAAWIFLRIIGAVVVVPIAEELAFRRYLFSLCGVSASQEGSLQEHTWVPVAISSLMFGALHQAWVAGTIAGLIYYFVMQRSGRLWDAVVAHAVTNALISMYVLTTGNWSYW